MKYMIISQDNDTVLISKTKTALKKAYNEMIKSVYEAYIDACKCLNETPMSKAKFKDFYIDEIQEYDKRFISNEFVEVA